MGTARRPPAGFELTGHRNIRREEPNMSHSTRIAPDKEELRSLVADVLRLDVDEVTDEADFVRDLEVDSLMALAIVFRLEKQYGVRLGARDLKRVSSLIQVFQLITDKHTAPAARSRTLPDTALQEKDMPDTRRRVALVSVSSAR